MYVIDQQKVVQSKDATFDENKFPSIELENENCERRRFKNQVIFEDFENDDNTNEEPYMNMSHEPSEPSCQEEDSQQQQIKNSSFNSSTNSEDVWVPIRIIKKS